MGSHYKMKINYKEPTIIDKLEEAIQQARSDNKTIETIELNDAELKEFCEIGGYAFSKQCGYTYKHLRLKYDWNRE